MPLLNNYHHEIFKKLERKIPGLTITPSPWQCIRCERVYQNSKYSFLYCDFHVIIETLLEMRISPASKTSFALEKRRAYENYENGVLSLHDS